MLIVVVQCSFSARSIEGTDDTDEDFFTTSFGALVGEMCHFKLECKPVASPEESVGLTGCVVNKGSPAWGFRCGQSCVKLFEGVGHWS